MNIVSNRAVRYNLATIKNGVDDNVPSLVNMSGCKWIAGFMQGGTSL